MIIEALFVPHQGGVRRVENEGKKRQDASRQLQKVIMNLVWKIMLRMIRDRLTQRARRFCTRRLRERAKRARAGVQGPEWAQRSGPKIEASVRRTTCMRRELRTYIRLRLDY